MRIIICAIIRNTAFKLAGFFMFFTIAAVHLAAGAQTLQVSPTNLTRTVAQGQNALSQPINIWSADGGTISYSITSDVSWLLITPTNGSCTAETNTHLLIYNTTNLNVGAYSAAVVVDGSAAGRPLISVMLTVNDADTSSRLILNVSEEAGIRLVNGNSSPYPYRLDDGRIRLYYNGGSGISSAISTNEGIDFTLESGTRISAGFDPTLVPTTNNQFRMYFKRGSTNEIGWAIDLVYSAISSNGLDWSEEGLRFIPAPGSYQGTNFTSSASVPEAVITSNGYVRLYYVSNKSSVADELGGSGIGSSLSTNGLAFNDESGAREDVVGLCDPGVIRLTNGYYWQVVSNPRDPHSEKGEANPLPNGLYGYLSEDGIQFHDRRPIITAVPGTDTTISRATDPGILSLSNDVYRIYYADPYGDLAIRSLIVTVRVVQAQSEPPSISVQPVSQTVSEGAEVAFNVNAEGSAPLYYQWQKNQLNIDGAISSSYTIASVQLNDAGDYRCVVSNTVGSITSSLATLTVIGVTTCPLAADFDGDGKADPAVFNTNGNWKIKLSSGGYTLLLLTGFLGGSGATALAADFDGDRLADPAVYQETTAAWLIRLSSAGYAVLPLTDFIGGPGYAALAADFDGDRLADPAAYEALNGEWHIRLSSAGYAVIPLTGFLGVSGMTALAADFDGDQLADPAVYEESSGTWLVKLSSGNYTLVTLTGLLGESGYSALTGDFDGDRLADPAVAQASTSHWKIKLSSGNYGLVDLPNFLGE